MDENISQENVLFSIESNELIIVFAILLFMFIVYFVVKYGKSSSESSYDQKDNDDDEVEYVANEGNKTDDFYEDLAFVFPSLSKLNDPLELMKYLFENKESGITEETLGEYTDSLSNFKNEGEHLSFDIDGTHFDFNTAQKEIAIDDSLHVSSNASGLFFTEDDKALKVALHKEDGEYVVDDYSVKNPEGISQEMEQEETPQIEEPFVELVDENKTSKDEMLELHEVDTLDEKYNVDGHVTIEPKEELFDLNLDENVEVEENGSVEIDNSTIDDEIIASDTSY